VVSHVNLDYMKKKVSTDLEKSAQQVLLKSDSINSIDLIQEGSLKDEILQQEKSKLIELKKRDLRLKNEKSDFDKEGSSPIRSARLEKPTNKELEELKQEQ
jgi:hypothetical protein